ncbi:MAG: major capsid protein [Pyrinomonadaceae bacterium]
MSNFVFPTAAELSEIEQVKLPVLTMNDPLFTVMPIRTSENFIVMWEQKDNFTGLQGLRGLDGSPARVNAVGGKRYQMTPGVYGEFSAINEEELTIRRQYGSFATPIDISDLVVDRQDQLLSRRIDRIRQIGWSVLQGSFAVSGLQGIVHADAYPVSRYTASVVWATRATATPLQDFRNVQLLEEGRSASFGSNAKAFMNRRTFNDMVANLNANDLAGRRVTGLLSVLNLDEINRVLMGEGLPQAVIYNDGYLNDSGTWVPFIANNRVIVVGARSSGSTMEYQMVRNATNPNMEPGAYTRVWDSAAEDGRPPRRIEVHDGHNGGPALHFPGDIVNMIV